MSYLSFEKLNQRLSDYDSQSSYFIIDRRVFDLWEQRLSCLNDKKLYFVDGAESSKNFSYAEEVISFLLEKGIKRNSKIVAIGGGALSDLAGYCASIVLRGVEWEIVPTTLLSLVDASIGGKTGINTPFGKNTVGSFHSPKECHLCPDFLETLPQEEFVSGKGEILKYAFLDANISDLILKEDDIWPVVEACREHKKGVVKKDLFEEGERAFLNFGHTFGHALEKSLLIPHGLAVTMGIEIVLRLFRPELLGVFEKLKNKLELEYDLPKGVNFNELARLMQMDKKNINNNEVVLIVPSKLGAVEKKTTTLLELKDKLNEHCPSFIA